MADEKRRHCKHCSKCGNFIPLESKSGVCHVCLRSEFRRPNQVNAVMVVSEWSQDEHGNMRRTVRGT